MALPTTQKSQPTPPKKAAGNPVAATTIGDPGTSVLRRLTRSEYDRTIHDLLGLEFDSSTAVGMQDEQPAQGYDNLAMAMNVPPALMEKYLDAADKILDRIVADTQGHVPETGNHWLAQEVHNRLFYVKPSDQMPPRTAAEQILQKFVPRAYRRPAAPQEIEALLKIYDRAAKRGKPFEEALRPALKAVLVSPYFLFRVEYNPASSAAPVDDYALATRLSYFLWSSMPDDTLFALAAKKQLHEPAVLEEQTRRMLKEPKARALTENFAAQWLQIRRLAQARPSTEFFPTFTPSLREAMYAETVQFCDNLRDEDRPVLNFLDADYTYLNEELAKHYGISRVTGDKIQRVALKPEDHRGGLLGMGSVLASTSHTYRTSPTLRGKWVLDVIFGTPPPPPPPGVSQIAEEGSKQKGGTTFRELLTQHAQNPGCAVCHRKIDPLGFALENYDAVGRWRTAQPDKPLDTSAQMPNGEKLNGAMDLKQSILRRKEEFVRNLIAQMLSYALGRQLESADTPTIERIHSALKQNGYRFSTLITGVTLSVPFRYRRADNADTAPNTETTKPKPTSLTKSKDKNR